MAFTVSEGAQPRLSASRSRYVCLLLPPEVVLLPGGAESARKCVSTVRYKCTRTARASLEWLQVEWCSAPQTRAAGQGVAASPTVFPPGMPASTAFRKARLAIQRRER